MAKSPITLVALGEDRHALASSKWGLPRHGRSWPGEGARVLIGHLWGPRLPRPATSLALTRFNEGCPRPTLDLARAWQPSANVKKIQRERKKRGKGGTVKNYQKIHNMIKKSSRQCRPHHVRRLTSMSVISCQNWSNKLNWHKSERFRIKLV